MKGEPRQKTVLITGASDGIGLEMAKVFNQKGWRVIGTGRRPREQIEGSYPQSALYKPLDMADQAFDEKANALVDQHFAGGLDLAILNAGFGKVGSPTEEPRADMLMTLEVNLISAIALSHALRVPLEQAKGRLTFIGSVAHKGAPNFASYAASKAGLSGFARALREEWRGRIDVQMIHPGPVATNMHQKAGFDPGRMGKLFLDPGFVARKIANICESERAEATVSFVARGKDKLAHLFGQGV